MTKTEIANMALRRAKENTIVGDVDTAATPNAELIQDFWDNTAARIIKAVRPSWAKKQAVLTLLTAAPTFEWAYAYQLPTDFVEIVQVNGLNAGDIEEKYDVLSDRRLVTNEESVSLTYLFNETDYARWDSEFIDAFSYALGAEIASNNRADSGLVSSLLEMSARSSSIASAGSGRSKKGPTVRDQVVRSSKWTRDYRVRSTNELNI